jgi:hypothetical protein
MLFVLFNPPKHLAIVSRPNGWFPRYSLRPSTLRVLFAEVVHFLKTSGHQLQEARPTAFLLHAPLRLTNRLDGPVVVFVGGGNSHHQCLAFTRFRKSATGIPYPKDLD